MSTTHVDAAPTRTRRRIIKALPGAALALGVAAVATVVGKAIPVLGGPVAAVLIGVFLASWLRPAKRWPTVPHGLRLTGGLALQTAVVLLGTQISLQQAWQVGGSALPVMCATLAAAFGCAWLLGRWLGIDHDLRTLIGVGTAICGASAIAAVTPVLKPKPSAVAYALSTIFLFNIAAVLTFPVLGHLLGLGQHTFGVFAGTAVNDTSSVVAAAAVYGDQAAHTAVVVKLTRSLAIIPVVMVVGALAARRGGVAGSSAHRPKVWKLVPWFLIGFVALAALNSVWPLPSMIRVPGAELAGLLITWALAAIGLSTDLSALRRTGLKPVLLGGMLWIVVAGTSLAVQFLTTASLQT
ncbi:YeiH family protein [Mycobacterium aquaticum]|uniref:Sulfate exporter family transporter n=1 Tax=Mycobacterium aquaticum TaxID=1927124 RepID=A0A1X0A7K5_9MYCO|nr:putative sulfate exporter family transporter [Mycobacterium aquaticum]ORA26040.1 hypothetical protein BST13_32500 [Mycobacterium aquaticum]